VQFSAGEDADALGGLAERVLRAFQRSEVVRRLEAGQLGYREFTANVLQDVALAQAMEQGENRAAEMFDSDYMPVVRRVAQQAGGSRAVDNLVAELILPRGDRPPKIALFQGRTPLASWLRSNVVRTSAPRDQRPRHRYPPPPRLSCTSASRRREG